MPFEVERDALLEGFSKTVPIADKKSSLPILSHVLVEASNGKLFLTATDLEVGLRMQIDCAVDEEYRFTVPSRKAFEITRELPSGPVTVEDAGNSRIRLKAGEAVFELTGLDPADYPTWSSLDEVETKPVPSEKMLRMIEKTIFCASTDDARFNLNSVVFEPGESGVRCVATDGHRLALVDEDVTLPLASKTLVPKKSLSELRRVLEGISSEVSIGFDKNNMVVSTDRFIMTVRIIDGDYPEYSNVIPPASDRKVRVNRGKLIQVLRRVAVLTTDRSRGVTVRVNSGSVELFAVSDDIGTAHDLLAVEYEGDSFEFIVNVAYLIESVSSVDTDSVTFEYMKDKAPVVVRPDPEEGYFNLVMPMRK